MSQGAECNYSGQFLEGIVKQEFAKRNIPTYDYSAVGYNGDMFDPRFLLRNVPYTNLIGSQSRSEFLYRDFSAAYNIRIECKWQETPGSVDEKLYYLLHNASRAMTEPEVWLVIDGGGARKEMISFLKREAMRLSSSAKLIRVLNIGEMRQIVRLLFKSVAA
jgi:hypothetical protein